MDNVSSMDSIVVAGSSLAGLRAAEAIRRKGYSGSLTVVGEELHDPYDRPPLSKGFLGGAAVASTLQLRRTPDLEADWLLGRRIASLDADRQRLVMTDGSELPYDGLVVATGAAPRPLPAVPETVPRCHMLRTVDDAIALRDDLSSARHVVIIGGGFIGSELASTCRTLGLAVTVITPLPLLATALGELAPAATTRARNHGVHVIDDAAVTGCAVQTDGTSILLSDGRSVAADVIVVAIGAVPQTGWLQGSGAVLRDGVVCDETLTVQGLPHAVAAGDVARWPHPALGGELLRLEHWTNAVEQAAAAARRLVQGTAQPFAPVPSFWSDQFGMRLQCVGIPSIADEVVVVSGDPEGDVFVAEYRRRGHLVAAVAAGSAAALLPYRRELAERLRSALPA